MEAITSNVINFIRSNWEWLVPWIFGFLSLVAVFFKKGSVSAKDIAKVIASEKVIATALSCLLEKEKKADEEISSEEECEETSQSKKS
ncbi:hypothetical protein [Capybara microvirus Cap3_SP_550]|nr:hypothetical protein [Capybara microvirus Cap3_SP_550]